MRSRCTKQKAETVTVPEKSHYENKVIGRKCSGCDKVEYY